MIHKLHKAGEKSQDNAHLTGDVEMDCTFLPISFKGTRPKNMIRKSKRRGKHKRAIHKNKTENEEPKICIYTAIDHKDNILFKVSNIGGERISTYKKYDKYIDRKARIIGDRCSSLMRYIRDTNRSSDIVPADKKDQLIFTTEEGKENRKVFCDGLFVAIGLIPENSAFADLAALDERGYFSSDETCLTKTPGIFVAGDCRAKAVWQITTAASDGAVAALAACRYLNGNL